MVGLKTSTAPSYFLMIFLLLMYIYVAPATPDMFEVCSVYDKVNRTLQIIETIWNEQVCIACVML